MDKSGKVVGVNFLNDDNFDKDYYLSLIKNSSVPENKLNIINEIIESIKNDEFILNLQEKTFIKNYPDKFIDYLIYRYQFKIYPLKKILPDFPLYLLIEPASMCNLRCKMCFQQDNFFDNKKNMGFIDLDFYKNLIDQAVAGGTKALTMASRGEPLLNKNFDKMLEYANGKFFELKVNTNATLMNEEKSHMLLSNDITDLVFSVDSAEKEQYENIRVGGKFDVVVKNIKKFKEIKEKYYPNSKLVTRISGVKCSDEQDFEKFKNFWSEYVDEIAFIDCVERSDSYNNSLKNKIYPCKLLWNRMYIWWNGVCNPCDFDYKSALCVGNAKEQTIKEIWHSEKFKKLRDNHFNGLRKEHHPCDVCEL